MSPRVRRRSRAATLFVWPGLLILIALGTWQIDRLQWKTALIETIAARGDVAPGALPQNLGVEVADTLDFMRVALTGVFRHEAEMILLARPRQGRAGSRVITPFAVDGGAVILVDRGWVPVGAEDPVRRIEGQVGGVVSIDGVLRVPSPPNRFVPDNEPGRNAWYHIDLVAMADQAGVPPLALYVEAGETMNPGGLPVGGRPVPSIVNNHLQYAVTWYGFAVVLLVVYVFYRRGERASASREGS